MSFGITDTPTVFMDLMNIASGSYLYSFVIIFIDDILVYLMNEGDHKGHLRVVLQTLTEHELFAKYRMCEFCLRFVAFLRHIISSKGVEIDPRKIEVVKNCPRPLTLTDIGVS